MSLAVAIRHGMGAFALDVAFEAGPGVTALFGPSGAGKTSTIDAIAGLITPREGRIAIGGRVVFDAAARISLPPRLRRVGYVFQDARLFPHMTVAGNLRFGWRRAAARPAEAEIARVVDLLGIGPLLARRPARLSGGEKARVALGRALLSVPDLLLLDEPLAALDAARRREILPYLEGLAREAAVPILYVSHAVEEVARLADRVVVLERGRVTRAGSVFEMLSDLEGLGGAPGAVIAAEVAGHDGDGLTRLAFDGGTLRVRRLASPVGARLRVRLHAEDILLAREEPRAISANNVLPAAVAALKPAGAGAMDVQIALGPTRLVARITSASAARLALAPGMPVFAIVKSVTVDRETV